MNISLVDDGFFDARQREECRGWKIEVKTKSLGIDGRKYRTNFIGLISTDEWNDEIGNRIPEACGRRIGPSRTGHFAGHDQVRGAVSERLYRKNDSLFALQVQINS